MSCRWPIWNLHVVMEHEAGDLLSRFAIEKDEVRGRTQRAHAICFVKLGGLKRSGVYCFT
jgi:hypothetical protein